MPLESVRRAVDVDAAALLAAVLLLLAAAAAYAYCTWTHGHWAALGVPCPSAPLPLFGHAFASVTGTAHSMDETRDLYRALGDRPFGGVYAMRTPQLLVKDPGLVGHVMIKDFGHFTDRGLYADTRANPLLNNIFFMRGERWKTMRQKLSPTFTANKLKHMDGQLAECTRSLLASLARATDGTGGGGGGVDVRETMAKFSIDVIGSCAFGLRLDAIDDPDSEFREHGRRVFQPSWRSKIRTALIYAQPSLLTALRLNNYSWRTVAFFRDAFRRTIEHRERHRDPDRKDFVYHLMKARDELVLDPRLSPEEKFTEMDIVANAHVFFTAGFETVSTSTSCCLYELSLKKHIQDKVRNEILEVKSRNNGQINSECVNELNYMAMVIRETLRKYPPVIKLDRVVTKPYIIPGTKIELETGTKIVIPVHAIHYDSKYYANPNDFDPERFSDENIHNLHPNTYMPFGDGPRICIGKRFAELEMKKVLSDVLSNYEVIPCEKTEIPLKFIEGNIVSVPESIWLKFKKLNT